MTAPAATRPPSAALQGRRYVVLGGAGAVGTLLTGLLAADGAVVHAVDRHAGAGAAAGVLALAGDAERPGPELAGVLGGADGAFLALPEDVALRAAGPVAALLPPGAVLVDLLSVKTGITETVRREAPGRPALGLNPMFAPSLGVAGRPVAAVVGHDGPGVRELLTRLEAWGARPVTMTADRHDRLMAATQALTHAAVLGAGIALRGLGADVADLAAVGPPPHQTLLALLARILSGTPEAYWDVQAGNPYAGPARAALRESAERLAATVDGGDEAAFHRLVGEARELLGPYLGVYGERCADVFAATSPAPPPASPTELSARTEGTAP